MIESYWSTDASRPTTFHLDLAPDGRATHCPGIDSWAEGLLAREEISDIKIKSAKRDEEPLLLIDDGWIAVDHLTIANSSLVISIANKYTHRGVPFLGLIQEGNIGLMRAVKRPTINGVISSVHTLPGGFARLWPGHWQTRAAQSVCQFIWVINCLRCSVCNINSVISWDENQK
jgi:hypothetical protein